MKCRVSILREKGIRIPMEKTVREISGDLCYDEKSQNATVTDEKGKKILARMDHVTLTNISEYGFHLRGIESIHTQPGQVELLQEWYCRPAGNEGGKDAAG